MSRHEKRRGFGGRPGYPNGPIYQKQAPLFFDENGAEIKMVLNDFEARAIAESAGILRKLEAVGLVSNTSSVAIAFGTTKGRHVAVVRYFGFVSAGENGFIALVANDAATCDRFASQILAEGQKSAKNGPTRTLGT